MGQIIKTTTINGVGDLGFFLFLSACIITCGWSPNGCCGVPPQVPAEAPGGAASGGQAVPPGERP